MRKSLRVVDSLLRKEHYKSITDDFHCFFQIVAVFVFVVVVPLGSRVESCVVHTFGREDVYSGS